MQSRGATDVLLTARLHQSGENTARSGVSRAAQIVGELGISQDMSGMIKEGVASTQIHLSKSKLGSQAYSIAPKAERRLRSSEGRSKMDAGPEPHVDDSLYPVIPGLQEGSGKKGYRTLEL